MWGRWSWASVWRGHWVPPLGPGLVVLILVWFLWGLAEDRIFSAINTTLDKVFGVMIPPDASNWAFWLFVVVAVVIAYLSFALGMIFCRLRRPQFYASRSILDGKHLPPHQSDAREIWACFIVGRKLFQSGVGYEKFKRLILPDPSSASLLAFERSLPDQMKLAPDIRSATEQAGRRNIAIKWSREFFGYSLWIANPHSSDGFVHIELAPPGSTQVERQSLRIYRAADENSFLKYVGLFEKWWDELCFDPKTTRSDDSPSTTP